MVKKTKKNEESTYLAMDSATAMFKKVTIVDRSRAKRRSSAGKGKKPLPGLSRPPSPHPNKLDDRYSSSSSSSKGNSSESDEESQEKIPVPTRAPSAPAKRRSLGRRASLEMFASFNKTARNSRTGRRSEPAAPIKRELEFDNDDSDEEEENKFKSTIEKKAEEDKEIKKDEKEEVEEDASPAAKRPRNSPVAAAVVPVLNIVSGNA